MKPGRWEVLAEAQPKKHLNDELAGAVCQHIVPAPLHSHTQVLQLAYACLGHAARFILQHHQLLVAQALTTEHAWQHLRSSPMLIWPSGLLDPEQVLQPAM